MDKERSWLDMIIVRTKVLPGGEPPKRMSDGAAGFDLQSAARVEIEPGETVVVPTGFAVQVPGGHEGQIRSRSGLALRGVVVANAPGTIDSDYRGEVKVILHNRGPSKFTVRRGDRVAQIVFKSVAPAEVEVVDDLDETERGSNGLGSTGVA